MTTAILAYAIEGIITDDEDIIVAFNLIREDINADRLKYEKTCVARFEAAKRGGCPKAHHAANEHVSTNSSDAQKTEKSKKSKWFF